MQRHGDMAIPTNKERLDALEERLKQIEEALGLKPPKPKSPFTQYREHLWQQIKKHWKAVLPVVALVVAVSGWFIGGWFKYYLDHRYDFIDGMITANLNAKGGVKDTLANMQQTVTKMEATLNTLEPYIHDVVEHQFENVSKLPSATLQERLPAVQHLLAIAKDQGIKADIPSLDALGKNLSTVDTKAASFWPTAAQFISYRSQTLASDLPALRRIDLPNCTDHDPTPMQLIVKGQAEKQGKHNDISSFPQTSSPTGRDAELVTAVYENCRFTLDSPEEASKVPFLRNQRSFALTFKQCQIIYRGGSINLLAFNPHPTLLTSKGDVRSDVYIMTGQRIHFENCLFSFVIDSKPPDEGQRLTEQLLAQSGPRLTVTAPKGATHS
jgi:hypothetical protein